MIYSRFCCEQEEREWEPALQEERSHQEVLHSLDINTILEDPAVRPAGGEEVLNRLLTSGFFAQPKSM